MRKLFSRSNLLIWMPMFLGIISVQIFFGLGEGLTGIALRIAPIVIGLAYCLTFIWFGKFLSSRIKWPLQLFILAAASTVSVFLGFATLVVTTSPDPTKEFEFFLPGQTVFYLILFFSALLTLAGFCWRTPKQEK